MRFVIQSCRVIRHVSQLHGNRTKYSCMLDADVEYHHVWRPHFVVGH